MTKKSKEDIHYKKNKANKKTKSNNVSARNKNNELFDFDKEIVIGMPRISDDKEKNKKNKKTSVNTNKNKQNAKKKLTKQQQIAIKKKKAILNEEILKAIAGSGKSYEEILSFIQGKTDTDSREEE